MFIKTKISLLVVLFLALLLPSCSGCNKKSTESYVEDADVLVKNGKIDDAIVLYQRGIQDHPRESVLYINQAALLRKEKKYPKAIRNYEVVQSLNPESLWSYIGLGRVYLLQQKYDEARAVLKEGLEELPGKGSLLFHLGLVYYDMGNGERAVEYFDQALDAQYKNAHQVYKYRGVAFEKLLHNIGRAKMDYQSYLMMDHDGDKQEVKGMLERIDSSRYDF